MQLKSLFLHGDNRFNNRRFIIFLVNSHIISSSQPILKLFHKDGKPIFINSSVINQFKCQHETDSIGRSIQFLEKRIAHYIQACIRKGQLDNLHKSVITSWSSIKKKLGVCFILPRGHVLSFI